MNTDKAGIYAQKYGRAVLLVPALPDNLPILNALMDSGYEHYSMSRAEFAGRHPGGEVWPVDETNLADCLSRLREWAGVEEVNAATGQLRRF